MSLNKNWFFDKTDIDRARIENIVNNTLHGFDDGELFLEYCQSESISFDNGKIRNASFNTMQGFGLRSVYGEEVGFAHSNEISEAAIKRAAGTVSSIKHDGKSNHVELNSNDNIKPLYMTDNPIDGVEFAKKVILLEQIDKYLKAKDERVRQVSASISGEWQVVEILRIDGNANMDIRPLVRLNISVVVEKNGRMESGSSGTGGRVHYDKFIDELAWQAQADDALRQALVNLEAKPAPAGELPVILGNAWCGVLLHEAVGHGLEGDFNRKGTSTFSGKIGEQVTSKGVTIVDDGTLPDLRGSMTIDDEGTESSNTTLIEDGVLKSYMHDRMSARLTNSAITGNGRRESYADLPMPRMTNTYMLAGEATVEDMIKTVDKGVYAVNFGGGQVDITSGKFVFSASEAYMIENGKVSYPIRGATLIGNGPDVMGKVKMVGNDFALDKGVGTCGKSGQSVPVGVGQPSMLIEEITIGGTEVA